MESKMDDRLFWKLKRIEKGIKLSKELKDYVDVTYNMLSLWENGRANMSDQKLIKYKDYIENYVKKDEVTL